MKTLTSIIILSLLLLAFVGCTPQAIPPGTTANAAPPPDTNSNPAPSAQTAQPTPDIPLADNPDTGNVTAPEVDTSGLS